MGSDGKPTEDRGALIYLGGPISSDGKVDSELSHRIGLATAEIQNLRRLWNHSTFLRNRSWPISIRLLFPSSGMGCVQYGWWKLSSGDLMAFTRDACEGFSSLERRGVQPSGIEATDNTAAPTQDTLTRPRWTITKRQSDATAHLYRRLEPTTNWLLHSAGRWATPRIGQ